MIPSTNSCLLSPVDPGVDGGDPSDDVSVSAALASSVTLKLTNLSFIARRMRGVHVVDLLGFVALPRYVRSTKVAWRCSERNRSIPVRVICVNSVAATARETNCGSAACRSKSFPSQSSSFFILVLFWGGSYLYQFSPFISFPSQF